MKKRKFAFAIAAIMMLAAMTLASCGRVNEEAVPAQLIVSTEESSVTAPVTSAPETSLETTTAVTEPPEVWATVSFAVTGDNLVHSSIYQQAERRSSGGGYDFAYAYENIADIISSADIAVINQETLICNDEFAPSTYPCFNSPVALGDHMLDIGFDVFTMANNHTLDKGTDGLNACLDYWESRENAVVTGAFRNAEDAARIRTNEVKGVTFSYLAYTESLNGLRLPQGSELIIGDANDMNAICEDIARAKEISDICVVALHWGVENSDIITDYQRSCAKKLAEAGADIIIGNHPHVLRDIEMIERDDGSKALCAYSLGNFISAQSVGQNLIGGILEFNVTALVSGEAEDPRPVISDVRLVPIVTHYGSNFADVKIYKLSEYTPELAAAHGVCAKSRFGYDYIYDVLKRNISSEFFDGEQERAG